jgi:hypothetical protein
VEYIGGADGYSEAETVLLAMKSLEIISPITCSLPVTWALLPLCCGSSGCRQSIHQQPSTPGAQKCPRADGAV